MRRQGREPTIFRGRLGFCELIHFCVYTFHGFRGLQLITYAPRGREGGSSLLYISIAYYIPKKKKGGGGGGSLNSMQICVRTKWKAPNENGNFRVD